MNAMDQIRNLLVGLITGLAAYLNPISGEMCSLFGVFFLNFMFGLLAALIANGESFDFKKAFRCIGEASIFFLLVCSVYVIGEKHGDSSGALQCVSFITYSVMYFYAVNIIRNVKNLLRKDSTAYKVALFLYWLLSVEFVKQIPHLQEYLAVYRKEECDGR